MRDDIMLDPMEARVLGCLIEKHLATPDYYPLSLSALTAACNQRSNREPVMSLNDAEVQVALDALTRKQMAWQRSSAGSRVPKYAHKLSDTVSRTFDFSPPELAVLCLLLLRGPQTVGELRTRSPRLHGFRDLGEVEATLQGLITRADGPFVLELPRQPGQREVRFAHLFSGEPVVPETVAPAVARSGDELEALARRVDDLEAMVESLRRRLDELES